MLDFRSIIRYYATVPRPSRTTFANTYVYTPTAIMKALKRLLPSHDHSQPVKDGCCKTTRRKAVRGGELHHRTSLALQEDDQFDSSVRTADVDISDRSTYYKRKEDDATRRRRSAKVIGDTTHLAGRHITSCMKVSSQSESLARIVQVKEKKSLTSSAVPPTLPEMPAVSRDDIEGYNDNFLHFFSSNTRISRLGILDLSLSTIELDDAKNKTIVRFNTVAFREYKGVVLSDNPSTSIGPAIGLGWTYNPTEIVVDLHQYESAREGLRRNKHQLILPVHVRHGILRDAGYSRQEIFEVEMNGRKDKKLRIASVKRQKYDNVIEKIDTVKWGVRRIIPTK